MVGALLVVVGLYASAGALGAVLYDLGWVSLLGRSLVVLVGPWVIWAWVRSQFLLSRFER
jgi:hypothetical protein